RPYNEFKHEVEDWLKAIPAFGELMLSSAKALKDTLARAFIPGALWEELGLKYLGPINGHDIDSVLQTLDEAKAESGPVLIHALTFAAGMATEGLKPIAAIYSTFLQRAFDQIFHDVVLMGLDVTFALDRAGVAGADGPTHHGLMDFAYLRPMPGFVIMAPKDENELRHMLKTA